MILEQQHDPALFRRAVADWLDTVLPEADKRGRGTKDEEAIAFQKWWMLEKQKVGLATPHWPQDYGGADLSLQNQIIVADEFARRNAPAIGLYVVSLNHVPSTLLGFGTDEQKARYLPGVSQGAIWCQGFSEPGAGSDLASVRTRADRVGDRYVVNGQKIWSSGAMYSEYCLLLVRTSSEGRKQEGLTYLLLDMKTPGIEVRPIRQSDTRAKFGELFLNDVEIPVSQRVGEENGGWAVAQATLAAERGVLAFEKMERRWYAALRFLRVSVAEQRPWISDPENCRDFAAVLAEMQAVRAHIRQLLSEHQGEMRPDPFTPIFVKIEYTSTLQKLSDLMTRMEGMRAQFYAPPAEDPDAPMTQYLDSFGLTISAGSNEIMRNLIAERSLGLPRK